MKKHVLASMVAAATMSVLTPLTSHAFGLGKINVMSALNEPFKAEIAVTALKPEEKDNLQVKMASQSEFDKAGLNRSMLINQMQFDIVERGGQHKILITSKAAIREPFLDFLVTATAGSGIMLREYTVLLDPPEYVLAETRPASSRPAPSQQATADTSTVSSPSRNQSVASSYSAISYTVQRSDTLWKVAQKTRPAADLTVHQMMMALLKRNPSAFTNENVNGLRAGATLQIPDRSDVEAMSHAAARQAFAEQNEAWNNRNRAPAAPVVETAQQAESPDSAADSEAATDTEQAPSTTDTAATAVETPESRLQLLAPEEVSEQQDASPNVQGNTQLQELTEQLTFAQETIEAQAQENVDLQERMALLEEQIETMRRMISIEDTELARMQDMLEDDSASTEQATDVMEQADTADEAVAADNELAEQAETDSAEELENAGNEVTDDTASESEDMAVESEAAVSDETTTADASSDEATAADSDSDSVITKAAQTLNVDEAQVRSTIDSVKTFITENKLPSALGLLLVLLVLWLIARRSNREVTWDEAVRKLDKEDADKATTAVVTPDLGDELSGSSEGADAPVEEKTAAELVEQADMFVGYADYVQAKSSLEQARALEPANTMVAYKTLFVLYKLNQTDEFVDLAEQTDFDTDSLEWSEISEWGRELAPTHSLFSEATATAEAEEDLLDVADLDFNEPEPVTETTLNEAADEFELNLDADTDNTLDADSENDDVVAEAEQADTGSIEFDLDDFSASKPTAEEELNTQADDNAAEETTSPDVDDDLLSFDTSFGNAEPESDDALNIDINNNDEFDSNISFDADVVPEDDTDSFELDPVEMPADAESPDLEFDIGDLDDIDEAETKLDLAAAYVDMGDPDGARSILNEVLDEGSEDQRKRANDLLSSLG